MGINN
jgi:hypothetical protein